jgi:hypothetical protein
MRNLIVLLQVYFIKTERRMEVLMVFVNNSFDILSRLPEGFLPQSLGFSPVKNVRFVLGEVTLAVISHHVPDFTMLITFPSCSILIYDPTMRCTIALTWQHTFTFFVFN